MIKKIILTLCVCMTMGTLLACGGQKNDTQESLGGQNHTSNEVNIPEENAGNASGHEEEIPVAAINKCKTYTMKRAENDMLEILLFYRKGSDKVARISGVITAPAGSSEYEGMVADNKAFEQKVEALNLPDEIMHFGHHEVNSDKGYVRCDFSFNELDAENANSVEMIAEFLGLPVSNGSFLLSECETYLINSGIHLTFES